MNGRSTFIRPEGDVDEGGSTSSHGGGAAASVFFIYGYKGFVERLRDIEVIVSFPRRHPVEIRAAGWF